ncbi:ATP-binding cassette domain-containing protein [Paenibacillus sp. SYP-B3998]|uniref:ATP-binding cassette domain-containing protein n=1 Tax=Paenibacillus sp. SYP-B3998 TaxID=2678564 RepID=A0A6G4A4H3_9BACL|nr:ATP-binding cassette domain-containing protein [Paenibacillus sp. SYP-B3998]NEW09282.1 ATP-binding cassette domain-containing protein [Paenibacillus sp. SYP-B3998]
MPNNTLLISLQQASVVYSMEAGQGRQVWSDISIDIHEGEWIVVTGPNGSGKSTLASVLLGLCPLSSGQLVYSEQRESLIRGVLQIPDSQFVGDTVEEELQYVPNTQHLSAEEQTECYRNALQAVGLSIPISRTLNSLSGGQKQLVNLAAALAANPAVLVLDEPTAMLDPAARQEVLQAVRAAYKRGTTIVWITHRLEEAAEASRLIAFGGGAIAFDGPPIAFFYGDGQIETGTAAPCLKLGLDPPFIVQTALALLQRGCQLQYLPLNADELAEAVSGT